MLAQIVSQVEDTILILQACCNLLLRVLPQVRWNLNSSLVVVAVWRTDTDTYQVVVEVDAVEQCLHCCSQILDVARIVVVCHIRSCRDSRLAKDFAILIYKTKCGICTTDVDTKN